MLGKIVWALVFTGALPWLIAMHLLVSGMSLSMRSRSTKSLGVFLSEVWDQLDGEKPDFLGILFCCFFAAITVLGLAIAGLIVAYCMKGS